MSTIGAGKFNHLAIGPSTAADGKKSIDSKVNDLNSSDSAMREKVRDVSDMYEKFFIKEMMRHMKSSLSEDGGMIKKNNAEKIFTEQLDEQYSAEWNKRGGFGISDLIYENILERHGDQIGIRKDGDTTKMLKDGELAKSLKDADLSGSINGLSGDELVYQIQKSNSTK